MRNVGEHLDNYAVDRQKRQHKEVLRQMLQVGTWDGVTYTWLDKSLNVDFAHDAAYELYGTVKRSVAG